MKRKLLALLLSGAMVFGASSVCFAEEVDINEDGTVNNPEAVQVDENKLAFWSLFGGGDGEFMDQIIADYNASSPAKEIQSVMLVWADYYTKLTTAVATGNGPDIGVSHASRLAMLVDQGVVEPINDELDELGIDLTQYYSENSLDAVTFDDEIYAIPLDTHAEILYFNKDILDRAGIELNEDGMVDIDGKDGFLEICEQIKGVLNEGESVIALPNAGDDPFRVWWATYFQMGGTPLLSDDMSEATIDQEKAKEAAEFVKSLYDNGYILEGITDHQKFFQAGTSAFLIGGTWVAGALEQTENLNFGVQAWPQLFEKDACFADSHTFILPVNPNRTEEESLAAVEFMFSASKDGGLTWAGSGQIPSSKEVLENEEYLSMTNRSNYMSALDTAVYASKNPNYLAMDSEIKGALDEYWANTIDSDTVGEYIVEAVENNLP